MTETRHWIPVSLSSSIEPGTSSGTHIDGKELVVWRDNEGAVHVWEDRCPHRGMRLSFGFVRGDHIACLYHGWQFDKGGQCQYIPAHPTLDVPETIKVPRYISMEAAGMIWTSLEDGVPAQLPELPGLTLPVRSLYMECSRDRAIAALSISADPRFLTANLLEIKREADTILVGFQNVTDTRIALHFSLVTGGKKISTENQIRVLKWVNNLRFELGNTRRPSISPDISSMKETV